MIPCHEIDFLFYTLYLNGYKCTGEIFSCVRVVMGVGEDYEKIFVEPISNAARPATLAGLSLTVLRFATNESIILQVILSIGAIMFLLSSFFIFFYSIYTTRRILWVGTSVTSLLGLLCSIISSVIMLMTL